MCFYFESQASGQTSLIFSKLTKLGTSASQPMRERVFLLACTCLLITAPVGATGLRVCVCMRTRVSFEARSDFKIEIKPQNH